jgi:enoyl-CoA hydratase/carnithine racemase
MTTTSQQNQTPPLVQIVHRGAIAEIALANGSLNLVTRSMLRQLNQVVCELAGVHDTRCVILHGGEARAFCAGSDIREFGQSRHDASEQKILFEDMVLRNLAGLPMPTIAAIDGPALGGGFELALCCDLRVVRREVTIGLPECHLGGLAGNGAVRVTRLVGPSRAKQILFTGEQVDAGRARDWGLVNFVADDTSALELARKVADTISARGPLSNRLAKELVTQSQDEPLDAGLLRSTVAQQKIFDSDDLQEGAAAFFQKRAPVFSGR